MRLASINKQIQYMKFEVDLAASVILGNLMAPKGFFLLKLTVGPSSSDNKQMAFSFYSNQLTSETLRIPDIKRPL